MLYLSVIVLLAGCGHNEPIENPDQIPDQDGIITDAVEQNHPEWVATSLTVEDLERIEETLPPISYDYETYDMSKQEIVNSGTTENNWETLYIPEYETMVNREVTNSWIEDDMIYTLTNITLESGDSLQVLYVNEPDTLFCRAISVQNGNLNTLYSNFVYNADVE